MSSYGANKIADHFREIITSISPIFISYDDHNLNLVKVNLIAASEVARKVWPWYAVIS